LVADVPSLSMMGIPIVKICDPSGEIPMQGCIVPVPGNPVTVMIRPLEQSRLPSGNAARPLTVLPKTAGPPLGGVISGRLPSSSATRVPSITTRGSC